MPAEEAKKEDLIDVGEEEGAEIKLDEKGEPEKTEAPKEEKIEVEQVESAPEKKVDEKEDKKEEKKSDELEEYSKGVQKRISKLTRKMREAERQREEAVAFAQAAKKDKEDLENRFSKLDKSYVSEFEGRVKNSMAAAKQALKTAIESQNVDGQIAAQEQIANLTMDSARLNAMKVAIESKPKKDVNITPQQQRPNVTPDPRAEDWAAKNTWFGNNSAMTYTAFDIHKKLVEEEGFDPKSDEYYKEIDKRIRVDFPHKFDKSDYNSTKTVQTVASATSSAARSIKPGRKTVKLTSSQVAIAKKLNVPLEDYAKQLSMKEV